MKLHLLTLVLWYTTIAILLILWTPPDPLITAGASGLVLGMSYFVSQWLIKTKLHDFERDACGRLAFSTFKQAKERSYIYLKMVMGADGLTFWEIRVKRLTAETFPDDV